MTESSTETKRDFGFVVHHHDKSYGPDKASDGLPAVHPADLWSVHLPHECEEWSVAGYRWGNGGVDRAEAISELERFISEAQDALEHLRRGEEFGQDD